MPFSDKPAPAAGLDAAGIARHAYSMIARLLRQPGLTRPGLTRLASLLLVGPFLLLSLVAPGYMPVQTADGGITLVICSGAGPVTVTINPETGEPVAHDGPQDGPQDGRCAWAQMALAGAGPQPPQPAPPLTLAWAIIPAAPDDLWRPAFDPRGLFARGPPATV